MIAVMAGPAGFSTNYTNIRLAGPQSEQRDLAS
jgi:hypothetical protein